MIAPKPAAASSASLLPSGIAYRWIYTNITATPVSNWVDIIQGKTYSQSATEKKPALTADGVAINFDAGHILTNLNYLTLDIKSVATNHDIILFVGSWSNNTAGTYPIYRTAGLQVPPGQSSPGTYYHSSSAGWGTIVPNQVVDYLGDVVITGTNWLIYTNGVVGHTSGIAYGTSEIASFGGSFWGLIKEIVIWTNQGYWSASQVSNVHYYATNAYGYSP